MSIKGESDTRGPRDRSWIHSSWWILILLCVMAFLIFASSVTWAEEMVRVKVKTANVRSGPGTKYEKIWEVPRNYPYLILGRKGRWLKVRDFEGFEDWIYGPLTDRKPAAVVKVKKANVREGPGIKHPVVFTAETGVAFKVLAKKGEWVQVRANDGDQGWISQKLLWGSFKSGKKPPIRKK